MSLSPWRQDFLFLFFKKLYWSMCVCYLLNHVQLSAAPWTVAHQVALSMGLSRQEYWSGLPFPSLKESWSGLPCPPPGRLPNPGIKPRSPALQADYLPSEPPRKPKNIGVGSLSFLQRIFLTQESNWGLWHCRWILYQPSYQGNVVTNYLQTQTQNKTNLHLSCGYCRVSENVTASKKWGSRN